jgi:hypothetical protein
MRCFPKTTNNPRSGAFPVDEEGYCCCLCKAFCDAETLLDQLERHGIHDTNVDLEPNGIRVCWRQDTSHEIPLQGMTH